MEKPKSVSEQIEKEMELMLQTLEQANVMAQDFHAQRNELFNAAMEMVGRLLRYGEEHHDPNIVLMAGTYNQLVGRIMRLDRKQIS